MAILKTGNPTIDDKFCIDTIELGGVYIGSILRITPTQLYGVYKVAGQQAVYVGLLRRNKEGAQHVFLARGYPKEGKMTSIWAYRVPSSDIKGIDKDKEVTSDIKKIVDVELPISSARGLYDDKRPIMPREAAFAKALLEKYLPE